MDDVLKALADLYKDGLRLEALARQTPDHVECSAEAAARFAEAARLSHDLDGQDGVDEETKIAGRPFSLYYDSCHHKALAWYHYQKREIDQARREQQTYRERLQAALEAARTCLPNIGGRRLEHMKRMIPDWELSLRLSYPTETAFAARRAWDDGRTIEALDLYRRTFAESMDAIEYLDQHGAEPATERIARGNASIMLANASQAMAKIYLDRALGDAGTGTIGADEALRILRYLLDAYKAGQTAAHINPEWNQIDAASSQCLETIRDLLSSNKAQWVTIYCHFEDRPDFLAIMKALDIREYKKVEAIRMEKENKAAKLWAIGSFWLLAFLVICAPIAILSHVLGFWVALVALVGVEVVMVIIGALILRTIGDLSEKNFLALIATAFKFQFRSLVTFGKSPSSNGPPNAEDGQAGSS
jgi:hypothetical protein